MPIRLAPGARPGLEKELDAHSYQGLLGRVRPRYANVASTLALFVALSGGAYAATALPAKSVGPAQMKKNAVTRDKNKKNAVDGSKVAKASLTGDDIKESTLGGVPSATLADTATSAAAIGKVTYKTAPGTAAGNNRIGGATATCDAGRHMIGGGLRVDDPSTAYLLDN